MYYTQIISRDGNPLQSEESKIIGVFWNVNGLQNVRKRREMIEVFKKRGMDVMGVQKTYEKKWNA